MGEQRRGRDHLHHRKCQGGDWGWGVEERRGVGEGLGRFSMGRDGMYVIRWDIVSLDGLAWWESVLGLGGLWGWLSRVMRSPKCNYSQSVSMKKEKRRRVESRREENQQKFYRVGQYKK